MINKSMSKTLGAFAVTLMASQMMAATFTVPGDFATLSAAVADAGVVDGDTINIAAGSYSDFATIDKELTILGANAGISANDPTDATAVNPARGAETEFTSGIRVAGGVDNVTIDGIFFNGVTENGVLDIRIGGDGDTNSLSFVNNIADAFTGQGITRATTQGVDNLYIADNRFTAWTGASKTAIWLSGGGSNAGLVVERNYISTSTTLPAGSRGLIIGGATNALITRNTIIGLTRYACQFVDGGGSDSKFTFNYVENVNEGVRVRTTATSTGVQGADVSENTFVDMWRTDAPNNSGQGEPAAIIFDRQTTGTTGPGTFTDLTCRNNTIIQNVSLLGDGDNGAMIQLELDPDSTDPHGDINIYRNNITFTGTYGSNVSVHGLRISGNVGNTDVARNQIDYSAVTNSSTGTPASSGIIIDENYDTLGSIPGTATFNISDNRIDGADVGMTVEHSSNTNINGNTIENTGVGIDVTSEAEDDFTIENNNFSGNTADIQNDSTVIVDAQGNFFDVPAVVSGSGSGNVDATSPSSFPIVPEDSDRDGLSDAEEIEIYGTLVGSSDSDGDGISDGVEVSSGTDPNNSSDPSDTTDTDGDGISDGIELAFGLDINNPDEDGDGYLDGFQLARTGSVTGTVFLGDANSDGIVDNTDAVAIIEAFLGLGQLAPSELQDVNRDGFTDNVDAIIIFNRVVGNIPFLPFPPKQSSGPVR